jgi:hypothetical protein
MAGRFPGADHLFPGASGLFPGMDTLLPGADALFPGADALFTGVSRLFLGKNTSTPRDRPRWHAENRSNRTPPARTAPRHSYRPACRSRSTLPEGERGGNMPTLFSQDGVDNRGLRRPSPQ